MTELAPNLYRLNDGRVLDTVNQKILTYDKDMSWLLREGSARAGEGVMRKVDRMDQILPGPTYVLPVYCTRIYKRGKTTYAELIDRNQTFEYPVHGKRLIDNKWVDFNFRMYPSSAYLLVVMYQKGWPHDLYIVKHKKVEK